MAIDPSPQKGAGILYNKRLLSAGQLVRQWGSLNGWNGFIIGKDMLAVTVAVTEWCRTLVGGMLECVQTAVQILLGSLTFFFSKFLVGYRHHTNVLAAGFLRVIFQCRCWLSSHGLILFSHMHDSIIVALQ